MPCPRWLYASWGQGELYRFVEKVDKNLAQKWKQQILMALIALGSAAVFFVLAGILGGIVE